LGRFLHPSIIREWYGIRNGAIGAESIDRDGEQRSNDPRRIWCTVCVARDGFRTCTDVSRHQIRGETFGGFGIMPLSPPNNLGISRQLAVTISIVSVVLALLVLVIAAGLGVIDSATLVTFVGTLGVVIPSLVSALKATEAADTASKVSNTVQFTASQHASVMQMLQEHTDVMHMLRQWQEKHGSSP